MKKTYDCAILFALFYFLNIAALSAQPQIYSADRTSGDLEILQKQDQIRIIGKKLGFIFFEFSRKVHIRIINENGQKALSVYTLPEPFDPTYISQAPKVKNIQNFRLTRLKVLYFKATVSNATGSNVLNLVPNQKAIKCVTPGNKFGFYDEYEYLLPGLKAGDEVEIDYAFSVPFDENLSRLLSLRLFPHDYYNIKDYTLRVIHDKNLVVDLSCRNGFNPDSSKTSDENKVYVWHMTDMKGCLGEANGRPYMNLPHLVFSVKPSEISYFIPNTFSKKALPGYFIPVTYREGNFQPITQNVLNNVLIREYPAIYKFVTDNIGDAANDTSGYYKLNRLQAAIVDQFKYDNNEKYYDDNYLSDPQFGRAIGSNIIQDVTRYDFYAGWISRVGQFFYSAYLTDIRSGEIDGKYYAPMFSDDFLIASQLKSGKVVFMYPKKDDFGYYLDEVPFYFEGTLTRLVCIEDYFDDRYPINEDFRHIKTPGSQWSDNSRKTVVQVSVNLPNLGSSAVANSCLLGQFSTMTRGTYLSNYKDETVNPRYAHKIWEVNPGVKLVNSSVDIQQKNFPFKTIVKANYEIPGMITLLQDSTYALNLSGLFPFIVSQGLNEQHRTLDFYTDFLGKDMFTYVFKFNENIKVISTPENQKIPKDWGDLLIDVAQIDSNSIRITGIFNIMTHMVKAADIMNVAELYQAIEKLNQSQIIFRKVE